MCSRAIAVLNVDSFDSRNELGQVTTIFGSFPGALLVDVSTSSIEALFIDREEFKLKGRKEGRGPSYFRT